MAPKTTHGSSKQVFPQLNSCLTDVHSSMAPHLMLEFIERAYRAIPSQRDSLFSPAYLQVLMDVHVVSKVAGLRQRHRRFHSLFRHWVASVRPSCVQESGWTIGCSAAAVQPAQAGDFGRLGIWEGNFLGDEVTRVFSSWNGRNTTFRERA